MQRVVVALIGMLAIVSAGRAEDDVKPKKNVLFIAVDDLRPSLGCYGDPHAITPNIDRLARRGITFQRAHCQVAVCNPSRASLMTGLRPDSLGVWTLPIHFREARPDAVTLPQWLRQFGYTCVSHGKIYHNPTPDPQSWSEPIRPLPRLPAFYPPGTREQIAEVQQNLPANDWRKNNLRGPATAAPDLPDDQLLDGARTQMAIDDLLRLSEESEPFFLAMGFIRPHLAWVAPKRYWDLYDPQTLPVLFNQEIPEGAPQFAMSSSYELTHYVDLIDFPAPWDEASVSPATARKLMHAYYACVSYVDAQIGLLLDALDNSAAADNTIIVLWSDHGWKLGEHNGWGKMTNYEIDTRVPLLICDPSLSTAGRKSDSLAELVDLYPTICESLDLPIPDFVEGESLVPSLREPEKMHQHHAFSQYYRRDGDVEYMGYAMRTDCFRYVEWREFETGQRAHEELYDHASPEKESVNIAAQVDKQLLASLRDELAQSHPPKALQMTPAVHSNPNAGRFRSSLVIENQSKSTLHLYPITPKGRRGRRQTIAPGATHSVQARIGGVFVVESEDGSIHQILSPSYPRRVVTIGGAE